MRSMSGNITSMSFQSVKSRNGLFTSTYSLQKSHHIQALQQLGPHRAHSRTCRLQVVARGTRQTRLATRITTIPRRVDLYFADRRGRQILWSLIAYGAGFYAANTVSLSFGALAINDVVAAALTVGFCEVVSVLFYSAPKKTLKLVFLNAFKLGIITALLADAFKLGS